MRTMTLTLVLAAGFAMPAFAQDSNTVNYGSTQPTTPATTTTGSTTPDNANEAWGQHNNPGANHGKLATGMSGLWSTTTTFRSGPNAESQTATGNARIAPTLDGRFVMQEFNSEFFGKTFKGMGFFGFNNASKQFESFWVDSATTGMLFCTGTQGADGSITWTGSYTDPVSGQNKTAKSVSRFNGRDAWSFEMYDTTSDGQEFVSLSVAYTRTGNTPALELKPIEGSANATTSNNTTPRTQEQMFTGQKPDYKRPSPSGSPTTSVTEPK